MTIRYINVALEFYSLIVCLALLGYQFAFKHKEKTDKWFSLLIIGNIFMLLGDIIDRGLGGQPGKVVYYLEVIFTLCVYYIASGILLLALFGWVYSYIEKKTTIPKIWMRICISLTVIQIIFSLAMPITKWCYVDPETNMYNRGNLFLLLNISPYLVYMITYILLIRYIKLFGRNERAYLLCFITLPMCADILQVIYGQYLLQNIVLTVGIIVVILFVQKYRQIEQDGKITSLMQAENEQLYDMRSRQEDLIYQLIDALCGTVEAKDIYTRGHSMRVAQYAREIMYRLGGDEKTQQEVYCIGILHDVGKISVKDEIINKNGKLTDEEYEQMKLHTVAGYQILREVDLIPDLAIGARWHHERYDGKGYPNGLVGENIPLIARIISVADAYDAMTSNRSYRSVMPQEEVREQIVKGMGTQFDPKIAQIMLDMIDEDLQYSMRQVNYSRITNILMVDDDVFSHNVVENILANENYVLTFASSGEEAIELMKENKYDLCLLDMEMPGMNGFEVLRWIHKNVRKMKVIFLTGDREIKTIKASEELGAVDYITKPINVRILRESVHSVLTH